jgi:cell division septum initiation protein DivIVA
MPDQSYAATEHALLEEITGPLQRLAEEPLELAPADFPTAMRGYDREAVDQYVRYTRRLVAELQTVRSPESAVRRALVRAGGQISGVLRRAHETAAEITAKSRSEAEDRLERARVEAEELIDAAERRVRDLDTDTDRIWLDRQRIMADVEDLSNQLLGLAKQAGERFPDDDGEPSAAAYEEPEAAHVDDEESAAWEQWADRDDGPSEQRPSVAFDQHADADPRPDSSQSRLTDNDETLTLGSEQPIDLSEPPEVEPRSARLSPADRSAAEDDDPDPDSPGVIPPMSEAANRPRRS